MDEERLAEIDRQIEALGQPETPVDLAALGALDLGEVDGILDELAEGQDIEVELAPLPPLGRESTSVSEPPTAVSASPPADDSLVDESPATDEHPTFTLEEPEGEPAFEEQEFDLPPPSAAPPAEEEEENLLGSGLEDLGKSEIPEPLSPSLAAFIDPPDSEAPSDSPPAAAEMPPNPRVPDLGFDDDDDGFEEEERTGLFSQEDIEAIRASQPPPPKSAPPPASASIVPSVPPPVPDGPPPTASAPPPPIPVSVAPPSVDEAELEILDDDDFELMIEEEGLEAVDEAMDDVIDELIDDSIKEPVDSFDDATEATEAPADEPVIREPEVETPAAAADAEVAAEEGEEGEEGEKKGFFKKLFG